MLNTTKRVIISLLLCGLGGAVLVAWFAPTVISWYATPPVEMGVTCKPLVDWSLSRYRESMIFGAIIGSLIGILLPLLFRRAKREV